MVQIGLGVGAGKKTVGDGRRWAKRSISLFPVPLTNGLPSCIIGCNLTLVKTSGEDPCKAGSVRQPTNSSRALSCVSTIMVDPTPHAHSYGVGP